MSRQLGFLSQPVTDRSGSRRPKVVLAALSVRQQVASGDALLVGGEPHAGPGDVEGVVQDGAALVVVGSDESVEVKKHGLAEIKRPCFDERRHAKGDLPLVRGDGVGETRGVDPGEAIPHAVK